MLDSKIELIKGDDTDFLNQVFLIISFKTNLDLSNYKCRFSIENAYSLIKSYEIQNNTIEINLDKTVSSTIEVGKHRCNLKLIDSLNRLKTIYYFDIYVKDEYDPSISLQNEYEIEIKLDDGISKYKNYEELLNKPLINNVELIGNKTLDELGITDLVDSKLDTKQDIISDLETIRSNANLVITKQDVIDDLDEIRSGANKGSTALQSVPDEYVTETELNNKGYLTSYTETDPVYMADKPNLALKSEIPDISVKADKSEIPDISNLATKDEIPTVPTKISELENDVYYATASDLVRKADKADTYTKIEVDELIPDTSTFALKTEIPTVPTNVSAFTNDAGYLTEHQDISNLATKEELTAGLSGKQNIIDDLDTIREGAELGSTALQSVPSEYVTETELNNKGYLTSYTETDPVYSADKPNLALKSEIPDISNLATKDEIPDVSGKADKSTTYTKTEIDNIISSNLGNIETLLREV